MVRTLVLAATVILLTPIALWAQTPTAPVTATASMAATATQDGDAVMALDVSSSAVSLDSIERLGDLKLGLSGAAVLKIVPGKPNKSKETFQAGDGYYAEDWTYPDQGIELSMGTDKKKAPKEIRAITITGPCKVRTLKGIGIGSTEDEVRQAYGAHEDPETSQKGETFVAGSVFGGVVFNFIKGRVSTIFIGSAAE